MFSGLVDGSGRRQALVILAVGIILRLVLDLVWFGGYGWHSVNHTETWLYYGVAEGTHTTAPKLKDPTVWMLRAVGLVIPQSLLLYAVVFMSAFLSSLTAVLIYYLVRELYGKKAGFAAGMTYSFMVEPLALSLVGFTHDHVQLLFIAASLLALALAVNRKGLARYAALAAYPVLVYLGLFVNNVMYVGVVVGAIYFFGELSGGLLSRLSKSRTSLREFSDSYSTAYIVLVSIALVVVGGSLLKDYMEESLEKMPQGRFGSADVAPITVSNFWLRNNILLFILPLAVPVAVKRKDTLGLSLTIIGFSLAFILDRGSRISDLGVCMLAAHVVGGWEDSEKTLLGLLGKGLQKTFRRRGWGMLSVYGLVSLAGFALVYLNTDTGLRYQLVFLLASAAMVAAAWRFKKSARTVVMVLLVVLSGFTVNALYALKADPKRVGYDTEYQLYKWIGEQGGRGLVLTRWDRGYMLEVVSGLKAVSNPGTIRAEVHDALWMPEKQAAVLLRRYGVDYVVISNINFNVGVQDGQQAYAISGGLVLRPDSVPPIELTEHLTVYKLRHNLTDSRYFRQVRDEVDPYTGVELMVYRVEYALEGKYGDGVLVGVVSENYGGSRTASVNITLSDSRGNVSHAFNEAYGADEVKEEVYRIPASPKGKLLCGAEASPLGGEEWGFKGAVAFKNEGEAGEFEVEFLLLDSTASESAGRLMVEASEKMRVFFEAGETKMLGFNFKRKHPYHQYAIANRKYQNLTVVDEESVVPTNTGVEVFYVTC